jgi:DNA mismatch repair ATPase MutS
MLIYKTKYSNLYKAIAIALACLFCANTFVLATPDTLAPAVGNPKIYQEMRDMMEERLTVHQESIDEFIKQHANTAKGLSAIPHLEEEFMSCISTCNATNMLTRLKTTLASAGGRIQVISVRSEDALPVFDGERAWGHAGTYVTVFALENEKDSKEGRRKIIARLVHEIRARSTRAKELFDEELKTKNPTTPEEISAFIRLMREKFEKDNIQLQQQIEQSGRITNQLLTHEFANLTFAIHTDVMNRDYMMTQKATSAFKEPVYGDDSYWYGNLGISVNDLANLGLIKRQYEYGVAKGSWYLDDVFGQFRGAPTETMKRLIAQIQKPERNHVRIIEEHEKILSIIDFMQGQYNDQAIEKLKSLRNLVGTFSLQNSNRRADPFMGRGSKSSFGEALRIIRNKHYPKGKWYEENNPRNRPLYEQMDDFPETTRVLLHLAIMILAQKEIYEMLPEDATGPIKKWKDDIRIFLTRKEIKPFLEREQFLALAVQVYNEGIPRNIAHKYDRDEMDDSTGTMRELANRQEEAVKKLVENKEFLELVEMHKDIWKIKDSSSHAFLRHFPHGRINGVLSEIDYYARICLMMLEDGFKLPDIYQPTGTVKLDEYKNPHLLGKTSKTTGPILSLLDLFGRMGKEEKSGIEVQPLDIDLGGDRSAMLLSGPNMGGKTTTARGVGLAVLLTQMGLPLPANNPQLGLFKNVYTIFPQPEQLHAGYGYFGMLIKELTDLIKVKKTGPGDLIILDEVPTGTDYYELVAVATVLLEDLIKSGATVVVTGHLKKAIELVADRTGQEPLMHTVTTEGGEIKPDFKLVPGIAKKSYAIELMQRAGFPQAVQDLARSYYEVITGVADSRSIPKDLKIDTQSKGDTGQLAKEADVHSVETVLKVLYPAEHFALKGNIPMRPPVAQEEVIKETKDLASGNSKTKTQEELAESHRLIKIFVSKGASWLQTITHNLSFLNEFTQEGMRWTKPTPQEVISEGKRNLELMEQLLGKLRQNLESLKNDEKIREVLQFLAEQIDAIPELRKEYLEKDLSQLDKKATQELVDVWIENWNGMVGAVRSKLLLIDRFAGVAQSVIKFKLKAPVVSERQNVFSLKNSKPFFPVEWSDSPFIPDAVPQSFALNPDKPTMVLTGPNSSGKTVLMFNSYMNAILALSGSYVSGDLEISRFNHILTFFGGHDDVSKGESYFLNVLSKYGLILKNATPNDVVILDELHGTDYFELAAIQLAVLHYLRALNVTVIFNTHVRDGLKILDEKVGLDIWQTDFKYDERSANVKSLYTVSPDPNLQAKSFGLIIAKEWLTESQYERAKAIYKSLIDGNEDKTSSAGQRPSRQSATGSINANAIINALPQEWHSNELKIVDFIAELSRLLQIENIINQDKSTFIFSEKVTFDNGLGVLLPKLAKSGMRVAVIATNDRQRALIDELNQGKPENERIVYADTVADIRTKVHTARYYYFKITGDPDTDLQGITTFDITEIVKKIIDALGKVCGIVERERIELLHEAARKFAEAA